MATVNRRLTSILATDCVGFSSLMEKDEPTALLVVNQLLDNALASANLLDDPREMISRSYQALEKLTSS